MIQVFCLIILNYKCYNNYHVLFFNVDGIFSIRYFKHIHIMDTKKRLSIIVLQFCNEYGRGGGDRVLKGIMKTDSVYGGESSIFLFSVY